MKLHLANFAQQNIFTGYGDNYVSINQIRHEKSLIVLPDHLVDQWPVKSVSDMTIEHFKHLLSYHPEIILLGTGATHQFPKHSLMIDVLKMNVGVEVMTTQACCRTYNILVEEGRRVAAAIIV
ncbi:uncharacterized conserved protein, contains Mth938-like domain [Nitrosomonas sp. PY1]|uniref:Mth938-like domain-containing protein n=1 Tax=Nitrosomonas sp. PY1 TaxID=1803906 RepID=UPI001FC7FD8F|nr:Mth938-like domain-containing protein [Nitrosomonas sp. PY1]GKS69337.1 uncharacterized conserved protein, contains Mth938-like domain [Nitrosomonas sp. PY1]